MSEIAIRLATTADVPFLKGVEQSASLAFQVLPGYMEAGHTVPPDLLQSMAAAQLLWVAADDSNKPVGFVGCKALGDLFYIHEISVAHAWQQQGIGRRLMLAALGAASDAGYSAAGLTTRRDTVWNLPFYASLGFVEIESGQQWPQLFARLQQEIAVGADARARCAMVKSLQR